MTARARLKNEFTEDEKCHNFMSWLNLFYLSYIDSDQAAEWLAAEWLTTLFFSALNRSCHRCGFEPSSGHM